MPTINHAIDLRKNGKPDEAISLLAELLAVDSANPQLNYQMAWCHDLLGKETEAVPFYLKGIAGGLDPEEAKGAYLGLGSTYRAIGEFAKSREVLRDGIARFPEERSLQVFLAMTLYNLGEHPEAMRLLMTSLAETSSDGSISRYKRAILFYADKLDQTWEVEPAP